MLLAGDCFAGMPCDARRFKGGMKTYLLVLLCVLAAVRDVKTIGSLAHRRRLWDSFCEIGMQELGLVEGLLYQG